MATWTTADLLNAVKARSGIPASNDLISDAEILQLATEVMDTVVAEALRSAGRYGIQVASDASISSGTATYALPTRAVGAGAYSVWFVDSNSNLYEMVEVAPSESWRYQNTNSAGTPVFESPYAYTIEGDSIRLLPTPTSSSGSIRIKYFERPGRLVETSRCGAILSSNGTTKYTRDTTVTPGSLVTGVGSVCDLIDGSPPFSTLHRGVVVSQYVSPDFTVSSPVTLTTLVTGDNKPRYWLCPLYESCVPQIPVEAHALLIAGTCHAYCEAIRDVQGVALAKDNVDRQLQKLRTLFEPRIRSSHQVVINRNSPLRSGGRWSR